MHRPRDAHTQRRLVDVLVIHSAITDWKSVMGVDSVDARAISTSPRERADIVFAVTARADVLKSIYFTLIARHLVSQVIHTRMIMHASVMNARGGIAVSPFMTERPLDRRVQNRAETR